MKRILITGGAGLVGSHAAEYFARKRWQVVVLDNLERSSLFKANRKSVEYNWRDLGQLPLVQRIRGDVRSERHLKRAVGKGVDAVLHAAGQPGVGFSIQNPLEDFSINAFGTLNVLECVRKISPEAVFMFCSTNKVYGENVDKIPLMEEKFRYRFKNVKGVAETFPVDLTAHTPYGASKVTADLYVQEYGCFYKMKTAVFRMSCIYGTRQFGFEDQGWLAHCVIQTVLKRPLTIYGDGKQVRDVLFVTDLIRAYERFLGSSLQHEVFNIGGGFQQTLSLLELLNHLRKTLGYQTKIRYAPWRPSDQKVYISDISKIEKKLGWRPKVSFEEGFEQLLDWVVGHRAFFQ